MCKNHSNKASFYIGKRVYFNDDIIVIDYYVDKPNIFVRIMTNIKNFC